MAAEERNRLISQLAYLEKKLASHDRFIQEQSQIVRQYSSNSITGMIPWILFIGGFVVLFFVSWIVGVIMIFAGAIISSTSGSNAKKRREAQHYLSGALKDTEGIKQEIVDMKAKLGVIS